MLAPEGPQRSVPAAVVPSLLRRIDDGVGFPEDLSGFRIDCGERAARLAAGILGIGREDVLDHRDRNVEPAVVQLWRAGDDRRDLVVHHRLPEQCATRGVERVQAWRSGRRRTPPCVHPSTGPRSAPRAPTPPRCSSNGCIRCARRARTISPPALPTNTRPPATAGAPYARIDPGKPKAQRTFNLLRSAGESPGFGWNRAFSGPAPQPAHSGPSGVKAGALGAAPARGRGAGAEVLPGGIDRHRPLLRERQPHGLRRHRSALERTEDRFRRHQPQRVAPRRPRHVLVVAHRAALGVERFAGYLCAGGTRAERRRDRRLQRTRRSRDTAGSWLNLRAADSMRGGRSHVGFNAAGLNPKLGLPSSAGTLLNATLRPRQPRALHRRWNLRVAHEPLPDAARAQVLGAEQRDADVDADDVGVHPAVGRMEGVGEAVAAVDAIAEAVGASRGRRAR